MVPTRAQLTNPNCPVTDTDYDAIVAAIMETPRGRWFLSEYARRNRQADTQLIVTAIDGMRETLDLYGRSTRPYTVNTTVSSGISGGQRPANAAASSNAADTFDFKTLKNCA